MYWTRNDRKHSFEDQVQGITSQAQAESQPCVHELMLRGSKSLVHKTTCMQNIFIVVLLYVSDHRK